LIVESLLIVELRLLIEDAIERFIGGPIRRVFNQQSTISNQQRIDNQEIEPITN
jgi:hypothetical protein